MLLPDAFFEEIAHCIREANKEWSIDLVKHNRDVVARLHDPRELARTFVQGAL
jgi:hypothetical protein